MPRQAGMPLSPRPAKPPGWPALVPGAGLKTMHKNSRLRRSLFKARYVF